VSLEDPVCTVLMRQLQHDPSDPRIVAVVDDGFRIMRDELGLPVTDATELSSRPAVLAFFAAMEARDDAAEYSSGFTLRERADNAAINLLMGLTDDNDGHEARLGSRLEGLVLAMTDARREVVKRIKYKSPNYTVATMLVRNVAAGDVAGDDLPVAIRRWVDRWCSTPAGKEHWIRRAALCCRICLDLMKEEEEQTDTAKEAVGIHIRACDAVAGMDEREVTRQLEARGVIWHLLSITPLSSMAPSTGRARSAVRTFALVVVVVGAVGSGKSSLCAALERELGADRYTHVDGDLLDESLCSDRVSRLGRQRQGATLFAILRHIAHDRVPIVSAGGRRTLRPVQVKAVKPRLRAAESR